MINKVHETLSSVQSVGNKLKESFNETKNKVSVHQLCFCGVLPELTSTRIVLHQELIQSHPTSSHPHHHSAA